MSRKDLQSLAKTNSIKANQKTISLIDELAKCKAPSSSINTSTKCVAPSSTSMKKNEVMKNIVNSAKKEVMQVSGVSASTSMTEDECLLALEALTFSENNENDENASDNRTYQKSVDCDRLRECFADASNAANAYIGSSPSLSKSPKKFGTAQKPSPAPAPVHKPIHLTSPTAIMFSPKTRKKLKKKVPIKLKDLTCQEATTGFFSPTTRANLAVFN